MARRLWLLGMWLTACGDGAVTTGYGTATDVHAGDAAQIVDIDASAADAVADPGGAPSDGSPSKKDGDTAAPNDVIKFDGDGKPSFTDDTDSGATGEIKPTCENYCKLILLSCAGANQQFTGEDACLHFCKQTAKLPAGEEGDLAGNTISCRTYFASLAGLSASKAAKYCPAAGPTGGNVCGSWCNNYCALALMNCTAEHKIYSSAEACPVACAQLDDKAPVTALTGDSVQCRMNWLGVAFNAIDSNVKQCPYAKVPAPDGTPCSNVKPPEPLSCNLLCATLEQNCKGVDAQYGSTAECLDTCSKYGKWPLGTLGDSGGNTVGCRLTYALQAGKNPSSASGLCGAAGPTGNSVCGSWCDNYCHLWNTHCLATLPNVYNSPATCLAKCGPVKNGGLIGATSGNTVQCRLSQLMMAGKDPETYCPLAQIPAPAGTACIDPPPPPPPPKTVQIFPTMDNTFLPEDVTISVGDTVVFKLTGQHTATQVAKADWDANLAAPLEGGFVFTALSPDTAWKPSAPGEVWYVSEPFAAVGMKGHISVK